LADVPITAAFGSPQPRTLDCCSDLGNTRGVTAVVWNTPCR
jgi:hypothetical protein